MPHGVVVVVGQRAFVPSDYLIFKIFSPSFSISSKVSGRRLTNSGRGDATAVTQMMASLREKRGGKISDSLAFRASGVFHISVLNRRETEAVVNKISNSKSTQGRCI